MTGKIMTTQTETTWRKAKLGEVADINARSINASSASEKIKYIDISAVGSGILFGITEYDLQEAPGRARRVVIDGDTILSTVRPNRRSFLYIKNPKRNTIASTGFAVLSPKKETDSRFLYYLATRQQFSDYLSSNTKGSAYPAVSPEVIADAEVLIPKYEDQKRIADILSAFDDKIELNNKISRTLEQMAQAIFKEWFIEKSKIKNQNAKLNELVKTQYGYTESASDKKIGPKFLRVTDINKTDWVDWDTVPYCKISDAEYPKYKLKKGDVVIARMADPGKVAIVEENIDAVFASYLIRLQITSDDITPYFLFYYLQSRLYQDFIFGASTGTTRQSANARVITDVELAVPRKEKILEFENLASTIRNKILANVKENQKLAALRDLLLPKLMGGEIRV